MTTFKVKVKFTYHVLPLVYVFELKLMIADESDKSKRGRYQLSSVSSCKA